MSSMHHRRARHGEPRAPRVPLKQLAAEEFLRSIPYGTVYVMVPSSARASGSLTSSASRTIGSGVGGVSKTTTTGGLDDSGTDRINGSSENNGGASATHPNTLTTSDLHGGSMMDEGGAGGELAAEEAATRLRWTSTSFSRLLIPETGPFALRADDTSRPLSRRRADRLAAKAAAKAAARLGRGTITTPVPSPSSSSLPPSQPPQPPPASPASLSVSGSASGVVGGSQTASNESPTSGGGTPSYSTNASTYDPYALDERLLGIWLTGIEEGRTRVEANAAFASAHPWLHPLPAGAGLSLTKLAKLRVTAGTLWAERGWEVSTAALAFVAFERLVAARLVSKTNRKLAMATCLLLAWKMNEGNESGDGGRGGNTVGESNNALTRTEGSSSNLLLLSQQQDTESSVQIASTPTTITPVITSSSTLASTTAAAAALRPALLKPFARGRKTGGAASASSTTLLTDDNSPSMNFMNYSSGGGGGISNSGSSFLGFHSGGGGHRGGGGGGGGGGGNNSLNTNTTNNNSSGGIGGDTQKDGGGGGESPAVTAKDVVVSLSGAFGCSARAIVAAEWSVFVHITFALHVPQSHVAPHMERLIAGYYSSSRR